MLILLSFLPFLSFLSRAAFVDDLDFLPDTSVSSKYRTVISFPMIKSGRSLYLMRCSTVKPEPTLTLLPATQSQDC